MHESNSHCRHDKIIMMMMTLIACSSSSVYLNTYIYSYTCRKPDTSLQSVLRHQPSIAFFQSLTHITQLDTYCYCRRFADDGEIVVNDDGDSLTPSLTCSFTLTHLAEWNSERSVALVDALPRHGALCGTNPLPVIVLSLCRVYVQQSAVRPNSVNVWADENVGVSRRIFFHHHNKVSSIHCHQQLATPTINNDMLQTVFLHP